MALKKKYKAGGTTSKKMGKGGKKFNMGGPQQQAIPQGMQGPPPAASFIEPPTEQPFEKTQFVAQKGGVRELRRKQRQERRTKRRTDRGYDKEAVKTLKTSSKKDRRAKPFTDGSGPIVEMSRSERRTDRRATNKASRMFKRQERKARRITNRADKKEDRTERQALRLKNRNAKNALVNKKLSTLNESQSSSKKTQPFIGPKEAPKTDKPKVEKKKSIVNDDMSFSEAYRAQRNANKASKTGHMDKKGNFTWKGKTYNTESKSEKTARTGKKIKKVVNNDKKAKVVKNDKVMVATKENTQGVLKDDVNNPKGLDLSVDLKKINKVDNNKKAPVEKKKKKKKIVLPNIYAGPKYARGGMRGVMRRKK